MKEWGDPFLDALEPCIERWRQEKRRRETLDYRQSLEILRALRLAPTLETGIAILENPRSVPRSKLDPKWLRAYGL